MPQLSTSLSQKKNKNSPMKIFEAWKKIREYERNKLPFLSSIIDLDIIIDVGFAEEMGHPLTLKQLLLLIPASRTTVRRRLARLIQQGVVVQKRNGNDRRSTLLTISPSSLKVFGKYATMIGGAFTFPPPSAVKSAMAAQASLVAKNAA